MDIKGSEEKLKAVDSLLTTLTNLLKKHWIILTLILIGGFFYWAATLPDEEVYEDSEEQYTDEGVQDSVYYIDEDSAIYYENE